MKKISFKIFSFQSSQKRVRYTNVSVKLLFSPAYIQMICITLSYATWIIQFSQLKLQTIKMKKIDSKNILFRCFF